MPSPLIKAGDSRDARSTSPHSTRLDATHSTAGPLALIAALLLASAPLAQGPVSYRARSIAAIPSSIAAAAASEEFRGVRVAGHDLSEAVGRVTKELEWHESLKEAQRAAQQSQQPIVWIQMLGDLDGHT